MEKATLSKTLCRVEGCSEPRVGWIGGHALAVHYVWECEGHEKCFVCGGPVENRRTNQEGSYLLCAESGTQVFKLKNGAWVHRSVPGSDCPVCDSPLEGQLCQRTNMQVGKRGSTWVHFRKSACEG